MIYNVHYDVSAMLIAFFSIIFVIAKKGMRKRQNMILFWLLVSAFFASFFDIVSSIANSYVEDYSFFVRDVTNYAYLFTHSMMAFMVSCYAVSLTGLRFKSDRKRLYVSCLAAPAVLIALLLGSNVFTHLVFYYDSNKIYTHGPGNMLFLGLVFLYFIISLFLLLRFGKNVAVARRRMFMIFLFSTFGAVILQVVFFPTVLLQLNIETLCLLGLVVVVENRDEIMDADSGCYNKRAFVYNFKLYQHSDSEFQIVFVRPRDMASYARMMGAEKLGRLRGELGDFLKTCITRDECYYVENDYFVMICDKNVDVEGIKAKISARFQNEWVVEGVKVKMEVEISTASVPKDIHSVDEVLPIISLGTETTQAEEALPAMETAVEKYREEQEIENAIRRGLLYGDIEVYYQPVWDANHNSIAFGEALLRFTDKKLGYVQPEKILEVAKEKGYLKGIEKYVLEKACKFVQDHSLEEAGLQFINTNLSKELLFDGDLKDTADLIADKHGVPHDKIGFEFSGAASIRGNAVARKAIESLRASGYHVTMDRYGAGYTDVSDLTEYPLESLKFDGTLLGKIIENRKAYTLMSYSIKMCKKIGLSCVAVGVETEEMKDILMNLGCDYIQGFLFSEALPGDAFYRYCVGFNRE